MKIILEHSAKKKGAKKKGRISEFSKRAIVALVVMWFIGAIAGIVAVAIQIARGDCQTDLSELLVFIGAPMTSGIVAYMLKSAYENKEKIRSNGVAPSEDEHYE